MSATTARRRNIAAPFVIVRETEHWRFIAGRLYRDCVARRADGQLRLIAVPEDVAA